MMQWHFLSPPLMGALGLGLFFFVLLFSFLWFVFYPSSIFVQWEMFSIMGIDFSFPVLFDKFSLIFSLVVVFISFSVMLFSVSYMSGDMSLEYFIYMVILFVISMNFLIFIPHLLALLLGWDGLGLTSYLLVIYYQNDSSLGAGMVTALSNRIGDCLLIVSGSWMVLSGHWNFVYSCYNGLWFMFFFIMIAAMTKSAQLPFSAWLPAAMAAPTPVSALVHSSTLVTAGVYLLIRFYPLLSCYNFFSFFLFFLGVCTCLMASMSGSYETDLKKIIALSTLSQLGVMMMSLGLGCAMLAFFHLIAHALFKALLFVCAGTVIHCNHNSQDIRWMGNIWHSMPSVCTCLNSANLALCGFPFMAGFYSKDMIVESFMINSYPLSTSFFMILSLCLTSVYSVRLSVITLWSPFKSLSVCSFGDEGVFSYLSCGLLLVGAVGGGAFFSWIVCPVLGLFVLPLHFKLLVLFLIILLGMFTYLLVDFGVVFLGYSFMGSMWFLSYLTSSPFVSWGMRVGGVYLSQEFTWMEICGGQGAFSFLLSVSKLLGRFQSVSFSYLFSVFSLFILFFIYLF